MNAKLKLGFRINIFLGKTIKIFPRILSGILAKSRKGHNLLKSLQCSTSFILILSTHYFLILASPGVRVRESVCAIDEASPVHLPHEHLEPDDGVDDDDEEDE